MDNAAVLAFKIRACELNISKSNVLLCNIIFGCDKCPWIQYWGDTSVEEKVFGSHVCSYDCSLLFLVEL